MSPAPLLVTISDGAAMLGVSRPTVYRLIKAGHLSQVYLCKRPMLKVSEIRKLAGEPVGVEAEAGKQFPQVTSAS